MNKRLAVFVSGTGSLLEAMISAGLKIALVVADRNCRGVEIARNAGIPVELLARTDFGPSFDRYAYTLKTCDLLCKYNIDIVAMAGYMTILDPVMFNMYGGMILNTHPSLLPLYKGDHAVRDALADGAKVTGCTIHIATEELDAGPILAQREVPVMTGDTVKTLHERIKEVERPLYPATILEFAKRI